MEGSSVFGKERAQVHGKVPGIYMGQGGTKKDLRYR